jgi:protoheme IX farnesyltransferase
LNNSEQEQKAIANSTSFALVSKVKDYFQLIKFTLSFMVVFSTVVSFLIAPNEQFYVREKLISVLLLFVAGMLVTGSANAINQILEKTSDSLMMRTAKRPVASGRMTVNEAGIFAFITGAAGIFMMWHFFNTESALISLASLFLYGFIYTPLKKVNSISVLIGGIPGALPCLIGWVAAYGNASISFWAIAWLAHKDYTTAGFKLLPADKGPTRFTAMQSIIYSALMIPMGFAPYFTGIAGITSFFILLACNLWMVYVSVLLFLRMDAKSARRVMFSSYFYLMIVLLSLFANRTV